MKISLSRRHSNVRTRQSGSCCYFYNRKSKTSILSVPEDILLTIFKYLRASDLATLRLVNKKLRDFVDNTAPLWISVSIPGLWPSERSMSALQSVSAVGNMEALIKLGVAHVYNEGIPKTESGETVKSNGQRAAEYFMLAESCSPHSVPFTWLFIRPPWAANDVCSKACVFNIMKEHCLVEQFVHKSILYCVGKTLSLQEDDTKQKEALEWFHKATQCGSQFAAFEIWNLKYSAIKALQSTIDPATKLQMVRELRECASTGHLDAQLQLCHEYARGNLGGLSKEHAAKAFTKIVASSVSTQINKMFHFQVDISPNMRYILIDWLVEVAVMKEFSSTLLHIAVTCVDRYLMQIRTKRMRLQLLGISCMLIASKYQEGRDIITIREAAWLTDNTYKYEDVVRMVGEVMACIQGKVRVMTIPDFLDLFCELAPVMNQSLKHLADYLADLSILFVEFGRFSPAVIAASCLFLSNLILSTGFSWPSHMKAFTGLQAEDLLECTILLHHKCLCGDAVTDHRNIKLKAVRERYSQVKFQEVGKKVIPTVEALCSSLCLHTDVKTLRNAVCAVFDPNTVRKIQIGETSLLDLSACSTAESGYDGDREDEGESWEDFSEDELWDSNERGVCKRPRTGSQCECDESSSRGSSTPSLPSGNSEQIWKPVEETVQPSFHFEENMDIDANLNTKKLMNIESSASNVSNKCTSTSKILRVEPIPSTSTDVRQPLQEIQNKTASNLRFKRRQSSPWKPVGSSSQSTKRRSQETTTHNS